jgi:uncharacterized protein (TIGR03086 family)
MPESTDDLLAQLRRSVVAVDTLIGKIHQKQWSAPTPCEQWDVRRVVEHLIGMNLVFSAMLADEPLPQRGAELPDGSLAETFRDSAAALIAAFAQPGALDRSYRSPLGSATGADRLRIRLYDLLAHGWDLAVATDQPPDLPDDAAENSLAFVRVQLSDDARPGRFGPPQTVPQDAAAIERLVAFLGRRTR